MTEDRNPRSSSDGCNNNDAAQIKQRKKRKWDQPAESLVSAGATLSLGNVGFLGGSSCPGVVITPVSGAVFTNPLAATLLQNPAAVVPKVIQSKIQDELIIAREIVINDAESSVRYKLTKRQTQEEIQKCTGAVVITRGMFHLPGAPLAGEKPLYLHISAGGHLKNTAERILAVDRAAAMVEEMLKPGHLLQPSLATFCNGLKVTPPLSTSVYLGFDADSSLNIVTRIRGLNDQYINHIMNETGATVLLSGCGSGHPETHQGEEPLHLFLSSNNSKSLEDAKRLAEHLLDTISTECGAPRVSSSKVYGAVPPPQQLLTGTVCSTIPAVAASSVIVPSMASVLTRGSLSPAISCGVYSQPIISGGTSYSGYDGIYPHATPLQQVVLALRQAPTPVNSTVPPTASLANTASNSAKNLSSSSSENEKRPPQRRKFQELSSTVKPAANSHQVLLKSNARNIGLGDSIVETMPTPEKLVPSSNCMLPPPPPKFTSSSLARPPPPPKFSSSLPHNDMPPPPTAIAKLPHPSKFTYPTAKFHDKTHTSGSLNKTRSDNVPDTLIKLMEYGDEDDDLDETDEDVSTNSYTEASRKPFWAV